jgi:hypothetical protein
VSDDGDWLDERVFGPPAHMWTPHDHKHSPADEPAAGALHVHQHYHAGEWLCSSPPHAHRHEHKARPPSLSQETGVNP